MWAYSTILLIVLGVLGFLGVLGGLLRQVLEQVLLSPFERATGRAG